ncbi:MAG: hypothetical protein ACKO5L_01290, partial [Bacteroidota bacterium]
ALISKEDVALGFGGKVSVANEIMEVRQFIDHHVAANSVLLMMSSGNFDGIDFDALGAALQQRLTLTE